MGEAALETFSDLSRIRLSLSSKHYLGFDAAGLGRPSNRERIFLPTDDPFGCVEAVVVRNEAGKG
jgi:urate oxidase